MKIRTGAVFLLIQFCVPFAAPVLSHERTVLLHIPAQSLSSALEAFYREAGIQMIYVNEAVEGRHSAGVQGRYTVHDAIERLLRGTGLRFELVGRDTVVIKLDDPGMADSAVSDAPGAEPMGTIVVTGAAPNRLSLSTSPEAWPASIQTIDRQKIESLPYMRATDMLRGTPGITFGSSSPGGDIGDDISIRGFSSFHGADVAVYVDGVPVNWPHSPMRHGMTDFNWLTPDMVERIEIIKGPFSAEYGNFNLSGVINIVTRMTDTTSLAVEAGQYGHYRLLGAYGREIAGITPFLSYEYLDHRDYRDHNDLRRVSAFNKLTFPVAHGRLSLRFSAAKREYDSAGFLRVDDVRNGLIGRRDVNPASRTDRGENDNLALVANYSDGAGVAITAYAGHDRVLQLDAIFNPTQAFVEGTRDYAGWRATRTLSRDGRALFVVGTDGQLMAGRVRASDASDAGGFDEDAKSRDEEVTALAAAIFLQGQWRLIGPLKLVGGARYDYLHVDVTNNLFPHSGDAVQTVLSPKIGLVWALLDGIELFTNAGTGFRAPASTELSPSRAGAGFNRGLDVARLRSVDVGMTARSNAVELTVAWYTTTTDDELRLDSGNAVNFINIGGTWRAGYEVAGEWLVTEHLRLGFSHAAVDTRIKDPAVRGADRVITVPEDVQTLSVSWRSTVFSGLSLAADLHVQRIGPRPLSADGAIEADPQTTYGAKVRLSRGPWSGFVETVYAPDKYSSDFVFDLDGIVFNPRPVVSVLTGVRYTFD